MAAVVVGAGAVGLACARALTVAGHAPVYVLEAAARIGSGTSSRNSEVIHAGIYYRPRTLKARLCVEGRHLLYPYLRERGIGHRQCGKLIVAAAESEVPRLAALQKQAATNGVADTVMLGADEVARLEPHVVCVRGLLSPSTGIFDSHAYMLSLLADAEEHGATCVLNCHVLSAHVDGDGTLRLQTTHGDIDARTVVNAAGLHAVAFVEKLHGYDRARVPRAYFAKGNYFCLVGGGVAPGGSSSSGSSGGGGRAPFQRLIYPMPEVGGLGIHATLDLAGNVRFGPDVEWLRAAPPLSCGHDGYQHVDGAVPTDYTVDPRRADVFYGAIRRYWPGLPDHALAPDYAGVRPKLAVPAAVAGNEGPPAAAHGRDVDDFVVEGPRTHGVRGLVNLFGIESPGLTASLAIAQHVVGLLTE